MAEFPQTSNYEDMEEEIPLLSVPNTTADSEETYVKVVVEPEDSDDQAICSVKPLPPGKEYHLFMSYSSEDRMDANTIRDQLENRFQLKCLYYERDFQIGKNIDENITEGIQKSVKALILLSPFYLQSHYCVTEAREVCRMSFTDAENLNVIPVVLTPLQREMPPFLNSYVYIDAQKELDVAGKIYKAFNQPGSLDPLQMDKSALSCNGTLLFRKVARKTKYFAHGLSYRFLPIEPYEEAKVCHHGVDPIEKNTLSDIAELKQQEAVSLKDKAYVEISGFLPGYVDRFRCSLNGSQSTTASLDYALINTLIT